MSGIVCFVLFVWVIVVQDLLRTDALDAICERIDFNDFNQKKIGSCSGSNADIMRLASYTGSSNFKPYRDNVQYYLSNEMPGVSCCETIDSFYMHEYTEIRLIYQLIFRTRSSVTLRILDMDQLDGGMPVVAQRWTTQQATTSWNLFAWRVEREIRRAKLQIEVDMDSDGDVAMEYVTVFNSLVQEEFCKQLDEYFTSSTVQTTSTTTTTTTTTTTSRPTTTTTATTTSIRTTIIPSTTSSSTTASTTVVRPTNTRSTTSTEATTTFNPPTTETTDIMDTTSDVTITSTSPGELSSSSTSSTTTDSPPTLSDITSDITDSNETTTTETTESTDAPIAEPVTRPTGALWIALTGVFIILFILTTASGVYIHCSNRQISRLIMQETDASAPPRNNFLPSPLDQTIHRKLQQQLKNRLRQQHCNGDTENALSNCSTLTASPVTSPGKYPMVSNVNLNRPDVIRDDRFGVDFDVLKDYDRFGIKS